MGSPPTSTNFILLEAKMKLHTGHKWKWGINKGFLKCQSVLLYYKIIQSHFGCSDAQNCACNCDASIMHSLSCCMCFLLRLLHIAAFLWVIQQQIFPQKESQVWNRITCFKNTLLVFRCCKIPKQHPNSLRSFWHLKVAVDQLTTIKKRGLGWLSRIPDFF